MTPQLMAVVTLLCEQDGLSDHQLAKRLGLGMSQLNRALAALGDDPALGGLALVTTRDEGKRRTLWLTDKGRALCSSQ